MDFLKKNLVKLLIGVVMFAILIFALINVINALSAKNAEAFSAMTDATKSGINSTLFINIGIAIATLGMLFAVAFGMIGKESIRNWLLIGVGILAIALFVAGMAAGSEALKQMKAGIDALKALPALTPMLEFQLKAAVMQYWSQIFGTIINLLIFGCMPIIFGTKKLMCKDK